MSWRVCRQRTVKKAHFLMSDTTNMTDTQKLQIWQQNLNRSLEGQLDLLHSLKAEKYDVVMIQEPHIDFLGHTRANLHWLVLYPTNHLDNPKKTRSVILINCNILTNNWEGLNIISNNVMGVHLHGQFGAIYLFNIYNECGNNESLKVVENFMEGRGDRQGRGSEERLKMLWVGDFNRHHPIWDEERNVHLFTTAALEVAQPLLDLISKYDMKMVLPKDIPTLEACTTKNFTRVDSVFCSAELYDLFI